MPSLPKPNFNLKLNLGRRSGGDVVGLDIQPGHVAAVQVRVNGSIVVKHAAGAPLPADIVREGEVLDEGVLAETLRELFKDSGLSRRVRLGVANQRTVLRTLELPPLPDGKELDSAVRFLAEDQVPMPLSNAVLDYHSLGVADTPEGPRQSVVLVAAQRDMVERLLAAARDAGLRPEGVDLSAFALIRSLYRPDPEHSGRVLYLNVDGLTNMAIAEGTICRFTRVVGGGIEAMAGELAERRSVPLVEARALIARCDLTAAPAPLSASVPAELPQAADVHPTLEPVGALDPETPTDVVPAEGPSQALAPDFEAPTANIDSLGSSSDLPSDLAPTRQIPAAAAELAQDADVRAVLENGIREIAGEVRNSLDFHRSQGGGGEVSLVVLSGAALDLSGFGEALQEQLGVPVQRESVPIDDREPGGVSAHRLAIATGLAVKEALR
jgi:type IV pilus assembly protein PilM